MTAEHLVLLLAAVGVIAASVAFGALALTIVGGMVRAGVRRQPPGGPAEARRSR
ncbi:MAG: hypothetical protein PGN13_09365 [Patulibacter minatonensis]